MRYGSKSAVSPVSGRGSSAQRFGAVVSLALLFGIAPHVAGCSDYYQRYYVSLVGTTSGTGGTGGTGGGDGGTPAGCDPRASVEAVGDACGVFVSSSLGDDGAAMGTKAKPFRTLGAALGAAKGKPVYACGEGFTERVSLSASTVLYGGLDCTKGWIFDAGKRTELRAGAEEVPLVIDKAETSVEVYDFAVVCAAATKEGSSSIAVVVAMATASFTRCDLVAGDGKAGAVGASKSNVALVAGADGEDGVEACLADASFGGGFVVSTCGDGDSIGGAGGIGQVFTGGSGSDGQPGTTLNAGQEEGASSCSAGSPGDDGTPGTPGLGATGLGTVAASGYTGVAGGDGGPGSVAQGGGGGGGAKGGSGAGKCPSAASAGGASGGSGGAGGCGGSGGNGGAGGGSSIALLSIDATLSFTSVMVRVGKGGAGGDGGAGQSGGYGGKPGAGGVAKAKYPKLNNGCPGGSGGTGGHGGKGGGGLGGHALGIAYTGKAPVTDGVTFTKGTPGAGGKGDDANGNAGDGAEGVGADVQGFP